MLHSAIFSFVFFVGCEYLAQLGLIHAYFRVFFRVFFLSKMVMFVYAMIFFSVPSTYYVGIPCHSLPAEAYWVDLVRLLLDTIFMIHPHIFVKHWNSFAFGHLWFSFVFMSSSQYFPDWTENLTIILLFFIVVYSF